MDVAEVGRNYAVGWGTLAGRSRGVWFLVALLLGPIATLIIVITDNPKEPLTP